MALSFLVKSDNTSRSSVAFRNASPTKLNNVQQVLTAALTSKFPHAHASHKEQVLSDPNLHIHVLSTLLSAVMAEANYEPRSVSNSTLAQRDALAFEEFYSRLHTSFPRYLHVKESSTVEVVRDTDYEQERDFLSIVYAFEGAVDCDPYLMIHYRKLAMGRRGVLRTTIVRTSVCLDSQAVVEDAGALQDLELVHVEDLADRIHFYLQFKPAL